MENNKNYEEIADKALDELFEYINKWAEKYGEQDLTFQGVANFVMFDPEGECVSGRYSTNISNVETFNLMNEDIIQSIEESNLIEE